MKQIFIFLVCGIHALAWAGKSYTVDKVPNPKLYNNTYVSDPDKVLKPETIQSLNQQFSVLEQVTSDQIAVVVLTSIGDQVPKEFATALFQRFRIGQKDKDNGLLILMVMDQHRVEFETGYGLEGVLTDALCKRIQLEYMIPAFKENNYDKGLLDGVAAVISVLSSPDGNTLLQENAVEESQEIKEEDPSALGKLFAWIMSVPYLLFMSIFYFVKKSKGGFTSSYNKLSEAKKRLVTLPIPQSRWLLLYVAIPLVFYAAMINFYSGPYFIAVLFAGVYVMILLVLLEKKSRSKEAYAHSFVAGDYYDQYNKFNLYFDNWGIAAVFFPIPFLFTDGKNAKKLKEIRRHPRNCKHCEAALILLDEKKDDEYLLKSQILEESIKSVDYDVWFCPSCHSHYALGYNDKSSKYKACSFCGTRASYMKSDVTKISATYDRSGVGEKTYQCMYCKKVHSEEYTIAQLTRSSSGSSGSSSSSSSFGGGSSGGGGAGSSW